MKRVLIISTLTGFLLVYSLNVFSQTCNNAITPTSPTSRFILSNNGTATDLKTGLTWMRCSLGQSWTGSQCTGMVTGFNWQEALDMAESYTFADKSDWRLPNVKELASIIEKSCQNPAINEGVFPDTFFDAGFSGSTTQTGEFYRTSSSSATFPSLVWLVWFKNGSVTTKWSPSEENYSHKGNKQPVRLVRSGQ